MISQLVPDGFLCPALFSIRKIKYVKYMSFVLLPAKYTQLYWEVTQLVLKSRLTVIMGKTFLEIL